MFSTSSANSFVWVGHHALILWKEAGVDDFSFSFLDTPAELIDLWTKAENKDWDYASLKVQPKVMERLDIFYDLV